MMPDFEHVHTGYATNEARQDRADRYAADRFSSPDQVAAVPVRDATPGQSRFQGAAFAVADSLEILERRLAELEVAIGPILGPARPEKLEILGDGMALGESEILDLLTAVNRRVNLAGLRLASLAQRAETTKADDGPF